CDEVRIAQAFHDCMYWNLIVAPWLIGCINEIHKMHLTNRPDADSMSAAAAALTGLEEQPHGSMAVVYGGMNSMYNFHSTGWLPYMGAVPDPVNDGQWKFLLYNGRKAGWHCLMWLRGVSGLGD